MRGIHPSTHPPKKLIHVGIKMKTILPFVIVFCTIIPSFAADSAETLRRDTEHVAKMLENHSDGGASGEPIAWQWNWFLGPILEKCRNNPTDDFLQPTEKILNTLLDKMAVGPDGYKGFIGPYIYNENEYWCDVHVSDSILISHALAFAMIVHDHPELKEKYGKSADRFLRTAKKDLIEKWNNRGTFIEDGPFGGYTEWNRFCKPNDMDNWFELKTGRPNDTPMPSLPFNKSMDMAECMLQIFYITGEQEYKNQAEKIFNRVKAAMNPFDGGYTWNYWEPISTRDVIQKENGQFDLSHWVGTHPYRDYQAGEVHKIVFAYDMGLTFTEADIKRLIHTNLKFMWNGDREKPEWSNSNSKLPGYTKAPPSTAYPTTAGTVWDGLSRFDPTIEFLAKEKPQAENGNVFQRKFAPDAKVEEFPWMKGVGESDGQMEAVAIPTIVPADGKTVLLSKADTPRSEVKIYVRPLDGEKSTLLTTLQQGDGVQMYYTWDGKIDGVRTPGNYVIIWKYRNGERVWPVMLQ